MLLTTASILLAIWAAVMWVRSIAWLDQAVTSYRDTVLEIESAPQALEIRIFAGHAYHTGIWTTKWPIDPPMTFKLLAPSVWWSDDNTVFAWLPYWMFMLPSIGLGCIALRSRQRILQRRHDGLCESCGYDLRGISERCPECGVLTWAHRRKLAVTNEARIIADVSCLECSFNLKGRRVTGECPHCGHSVALAALSQVAKSTGHTDARVKFIRAACLHIFRRRFTSQPEAQLHLNARALCLKIKDYAIWQGGNSERAFVLLNDLGFKTSNDIGEIIFGMVAVGLIKARPEERPEDFVGLFTLDELFAASQS
ncbi:MAG TPA: hypothetical protein VIM11_28260 [Tepidisphaeraceae bacterium]|jgi:uncharacterized repeat protein (TIGR04138 family)